jgi:UDP-2,3-diacylglucosamine hydrolase
VITRALFVSDIHISSPDDPKYVLFGRFLDQCLSEHIDQLFLVGDIFDFWIADRRYLVRAYADVIDKIQKLIESGVRVHYFEGNHDLDLRAFWQDKLGAEVHSGPAFFHVGPVIVRVEHGDQMDPEDRGYLFLRWLLRTPILVWLGRWLPEFVVKRIGQRASAASRDYTSQIKTTSDREARFKIRAHAEKAVAMKPFDVLVSGHVHVSEYSLQVAHGHAYRCVNLGTWLKEPLVFEIHGAAMELKELKDFLGDK